MISPQNGIRSFIISEAKLSEKPNVIGQIIPFSVTATLGGQSKLEFLPGWVTELQYLYLFFSIGLDSILKF